MKPRIFLKNNLFILFVLSLTGILVHFKSFQMVPYGDDWKFIYNFFTHEEIGSNFSFLPGIFSYLAPYGPSILTIGFLYKIFGEMYFIYYLFPLIFKILTAFFLFIILQHISGILKKSNYFINFLSAVLFLVSATGLQAIDWSMNMNVYIGLSFFVLSLFFQIKFYNFSGKLNLVIGLILSLFSIIIIPIRLSSLIFIVPLIDLIMVIKNKDKTTRTAVIFKNIIFGVFIFVFWLIGVFGIGAASIYSPYPHPIEKFIYTVSSEPFDSLKVFLHWVGVMILPIYLISNTIWTKLLGAIFLTFLLVIFYKSRSKYIIIGCLVFFIPFVLMWMITPLRIIDSVDRYLPPAFLGLCFLIGLLSMFTGKLKNIFKIVIILIILMQVYSVSRIYSYWLAIGRGYNFINEVQKQIMNNFPTPIKSSRIVYLDFDDGNVQQSVVFGLGYRIAVLSGTKKISLFPKLIVDKPTLIKTIKEEMTRGISKEKVINSVATFQYKNKQFSDVTFAMQEILIEEIK